MNDKPALNELPALLAEELARIDGLNPVTGGIIRGILDDAVARVAELEEAKTYWRDRAETAEALAYERLENMLFAEQRATDAEIERDEAVGRAEAAEASAAELERINVESYRAYLTLKEKEDAGGEPLREACRQNMTLAARVAELQAEFDVALDRVAELQAELAAHRAAHRWRPVTEPPVAVSTYRDRAIAIIADLKATAAKAEDLRFAARLEAHGLAIRVIELNHLLATRDLRIAELESQLAALGQEPTP